MKFDDVLKQIGEFGRYQQWVFFLTALPSLLGAFEAVSVIFTFNIPKHRCAIPGYDGDTYHIINDSHALIINRTIPLENGEWSECQIYSDTFVSPANSSNFSSGSATEREGRTPYTKSAIKTDCTNWVFDHSVFENTIATEFNVVCDRSVLRATSNLVAEMGCLFGTLVCGFAADKFGRKIPFYIGAVGLIAGGFGIAFTTNLITLNICRFLLGMARLACWINGLVIEMELVGPSKRVFIGVAMEMAWCMGTLLMLAFVYPIRQWRYLEIALSVPGIGLLTYWWLIPESPRWLASHGREEEALQVLNKITSSNKTKLPEVDAIEDLVEKETTLIFRHVFKSRELIKRMLILFSNMFVLCVIYYALFLNITNLAGDIFINYLISVVLETVCYACPYFLLDRVGRKPVYCIAILVAGAACVVSVVPDLLQAPDWILVSLTMVGRFGVCVCYSVIYIYGAELFPTVIRGSAMGVGVTFSRIGGLLSPYLADVGILVLGRLRNALPLIVMGSPALLVGIVAFWLPETKGIKLPETFDDVSNIQSKRCFGCCVVGDGDVKEVTVDGDADDQTTSHV